MELHKTLRHTSVCGEKTFPVGSTVGKITTQNISSMILCAGNSRRIKVEGRKERQLSTGSYFLFPHPLWCELFCFLTHSVSAAIYLAIWHYESIISLLLWHLRRGIWSQWWQHNQQKRRWRNDLCFESPALFLSRVMGIHIFHDHTFHCRISHRHKNLRLLSSLCLYRDKLCKHSRSK